MKIESVLETISTAIERNDPGLLAQSIKMLLERAENFITGSRWELLDTLCISSDKLLANARTHANIQNNQFWLMADLTQQAIAVLQFVAHARGERMSGNFIAAQRQAQRLDKMTGEQLKLLELVELVPKDDAAPNIPLML